MDKINDPAKKSTRRLRRQNKSATTDRLPLRVATRQLTATVTRGVDVGTVTGANLSAQYNQGYYFTLDQLPSYTEMTALFDQFRITRIRFEVRPTFTQVPQPTSGASWLSPNVFSAIDYDDSTALSTINDYLQRDTLMLTRGHELHSREFVPKLALATYGGVATSGYALGGNMWCDTSYYNTRYYGLKLGFESAGGSGTTYLYRLFAFYTVELRRTQ